MTKELKKTVFGDTAATVFINPSIFSLEVAQLAAYSLGDRGHFVFGGDPGEEIVVEIRAKGSESIHTLVDSYHEELLSYAVHKTINAKNHEIIELILRRVLATNADNEEPTPPMKTPPLPGKTRW